jgi:glycosyltransferase involved in cell wall biosynthesis
LIALLKSIDPLVSVIVPAYNGSRTILRTLSSIVKQDLVPFELIVIDDGSSDSTSSLVDNYFRESEFSGKFSLIKHLKNLGLSMTLNDGLQRAHGRYVLILHQDCEFVGSDWISRALSNMNNDSVAVVTGYYGISDVEDESFVKRAFGVLRKQFHSCPKISCEEVTFSEGKCDLYRLSYLLKAGGFPTSYRIAGEDLIVSYTLRNMGYLILKCYDLQVVQRFTGDAETFVGNLRKEFLFGKVIGGVFSQFRFFLFKGVKNSEYSGSRSIHRATQPIFVGFFVFFCLLSLFLFWFGFVVAGLFIARWLYYIDRVFSETRVYLNPVNHIWRESLAIALVGILTDFSYTFGFIYGSFRSVLKKKL